MFHLSRFVYDSHSNILWCQIPKAGSTTIFDAYNKVARKYGKGNFNKVGKKFQERSRVKKMLPFNDENKAKILRRKPFLFSVVRHPYERLVSAYIDFSSKTRSKNKVEGSFQVLIEKYL